MRRKYRVLKLLNWMLKALDLIGIQRNTEGLKLKEDLIKTIKDVEKDQ